MEFSRLDSFGKYPKLSNIESPPSLQTIAFQAIKEAIIANEFLPGRVYSERTVAKILGISKTPVHHALVDLAAKGLVTIIPQKGFQVKVLTLADAENMYTFRLALEKAVITDIINRLSDKDFERLVRIVSNMSGARNSVEFQNHDRSFHMHLASLTQNSFIVKALDNIWDLSDWLGTLATSADRVVFERIVNEHRAIMDMLKKRDTKKSLSTLEKHIQGGIRRYVNSCRAKETKQHERR